MAACLVVLADKWPECIELHFIGPFWRINKCHGLVEGQVVAVHVVSQQDVSSSLLRPWSLSNLQNMYTR
jgi:hypothetical protein